MIERREFLQELDPRTQEVSWPHSSSWGEEQDRIQILGIEDPYDPDPYK